MKTTMKEELGITNAQYGVISSASNLINTVMPIITGIATDYYGPSAIGIVSSVFILVGSILTAVGTNVNNFTV